PGELISEKKARFGPGESLLIGRAGKGDVVQAVWFTPAKVNPDVPPALIVHPDGAQWVTVSAQNAGGLAKGLLDRGGIVMGIDAFQTGSAKAVRDRSGNGFTWFNQTDDANRVQDILTAVAYLEKRTGAQTVNLIGLEIAGVWTYFARSLA